MPLMALDHPRRPHLPLPGDTEVTGYRTPSFQLSLSLMSALPHLKHSHTTFVNSVLTDTR